MDPETGPILQVQGQVSPCISTISSAPPHSKHTCFLLALFYLRAFAPGILIDLNTKDCQNEEYPPHVSLNQLHLIFKISSESSLC